MPDARTRRKHSVKPQEGGYLEKPYPTLVEDVTMDIKLDEPTQDVVSVVLLRSMIVKVVGKNTGRMYVFNGAGSVLDDVDRLDAEAMLQKAGNTSCCGTQSTPYFQILGR